MKIAVLDDYQDVALASAPWAELGPDAEVVRFTDHVDDVDELARRLQDADVLVLMRERTPVTSELLERLPKLRLITTTGMANAAIDLAAARGQGVTVCGTIRSTYAAAELSWALLMAAARDIPANDRDVRAGYWQRRIGIDLDGSTLGLLGLGRLGTKMAGYAKAFGMEVLAWSPNLTPERAAAGGAVMVEKDDLFRRSDIVSIHLRYSERTKGLVGRRELDLLGSEGRLVNTSRGPIVQEAELVAALHGRRIAAAALDVYDVEPLPADSPLRAAPNLILSPHIGFVTKRAHRLGYTQMLEDIQAFRAGSPVNVLT
ncbi:D-2-hydroxyacid dehydrogenase family protein [Arthrobacter mobilis]|uniref:D-2-hydroxyacid dehydrogenase family protein n=1 Tax=Arthrobacter mobilis TaxID=2724944 RepID=A0A7X6K4M8_9MICC|nr:D-2-hydroxyacid dehydrogenase family protein [Arthrobacter mobilis]NKX54805.1 D-2-hydroxyacid dehydrogenase family protein [Arthrobacter mobilis]